jgi:lipopolysaccharide cholinephosphotransferase
MEINVPNGFLSGEIRDGFYIEQMMKKIWACMIKIIAEIDRICRKYDITYFADWGTLLGAVRHKGFIPWDDDIDIGMLRPDYERFNAVVEDELPKGWKFLNIYNQKEWNNQFERVVTDGFVRYDKEHLDEFYGFPYIAGVDIFPYDYVAPTEEEDEYIRNVEKIVLYVAQTWKNDTYTVDEREELLAQIEQMCRIKLDRNSDTVNQLYRLYDKLAQMYSKEEASYIALMPELDNVRKECYSDTVLLDFEYIKIPVPVGYEEILEHRYGKDWRVPKLICGGHDYPYYKKQRDAALEQMREGLWI